MQTFVYAIGTTEDLTPPYKNCYIGVTNKLERRWRNHMKSPYTIGFYIRNNDLKFEDNMIVLFVGNEELCYAKELELRPEPYMGLNEAIGGHGGYTKYTAERNKKISEKMQGRIIPPEWVKKATESKKKNGTLPVGSRNIQAKQWILIDPNGNEYMVYGELEKFCNDHKILISTLRQYKDTVVPPLSIGRGGFRAKTQNSLALRLNTVGWSLQQKEK